MKSPVANLKAALRAAAAPEFLSNRANRAAGNSCLTTSQVPSVDASSPMINSQSPTHWFIIEFKARPMQ
jgi:hypothetical protein